MPLVDNTYTSADLELCNNGSIESYSLAGLYPNGWSAGALAGAGAPTITATSISQDQIDISLTAKAGSGTQIERGETAVGPFSTVAVYPESDTSISLFDHQHARQYWFRAKFVSPSGDSAYSSIVTATTAAPLAEYFVSPAGSDANDGLTEGNAFLTLDKAAQEVAAGSAVTIVAGTYNTASALTASLTSIAPICYLRASGTEANPICWRAKEGDEGSVIIDGNTADNHGFYVNNQDHNGFLNLEIQNVRLAGILNAGSRDVPINLAGMSQNCRVNNCYIHHVDAKQNGSNPGGLRLDGTYGWTIRNNEIGYIAANLAGGGNYRDANAEAIKCYVGAGHVIENNKMYEAGAGVHFKDHTETAGGVPYGSTVRFNEIHDALRAVYITTGDGTGKAGNHSITHNIGHDLSNEFISAYYLPAGSGTATIHHNISDMPSGPAVLLAGYDGGNGEGNIFIGEAYRLFDTAGILDSTDYNIFVGVDIRADWNGGGYQQYTSLAAWQAVQAATHNTVNLSNPDANSITSTTGALFTNAAANDYSHAGASSALALMPDGSNAGAYQYGTETIGVMNQWWA